MYCMNTLKQIVNCRKSRHICPHCGEDTRSESVPVDTLKDFIFKLTSRVAKISKKDMISRRQDRECVFARQIVMVMLYHENVMSCTKVGNVFGRDHSTVLYSMKKIQDLSDTDPNVKRRVDFIRRKVEERKAELTT